MEAQLAWRASLKLALLMPVLFWYSHMTNQGIPYMTYQTGCHRQQTSNWSYSSLLNVMMCYPVCRVILSKLLIIHIFFSLKAIEKAIVSSDLGMTPNNDGESIQLRIPQLTSDRRKVFSSSIDAAVSKFIFSLSITFLFSLTESNILNWFSFLI